MPLVLETKTPSLLALSILLCVLPALASDTWIMTNNPEITQPTSGTIGSEYGWWGIGFFVNTNSITRQGNMAYFNEAIILLGKDKLPCANSTCGWNHSSNIPVRSHPRIANCSTGQIANGIGDRVFKSPNKGASVVKFVCGFR